LSFGSRIWASAIFVNVLICSSFNPASFNFSATNMVSLFISNAASALLPALSFVRAGLIAGLFLDPVLVDFPSVI
jgi:hypothetical protein